MNLEPAASCLREAVNGTERMRGGVKVPVPGLMDLILAAQLPLDKREAAILNLGRILGVADALQGIRDKP